MGNKETYINKFINESQFVTSYHTLKGSILTNFY